MKCYLLYAKDLPEKQEEQEKLYPYLPGARVASLQKRKHSGAARMHLAAGLLMSYAALKGQTQGKTEYLTGERLTGAILSLQESLKKTGGLWQLPDIEADKMGKPYFKVPFEKLHFNLSHSGDYVLLVMSAEPIGCDLQKMVVKRNQQLVARKVMPDTVYTGYEKLSAEDKTTFFYHQWCIREAYGKYTGDGVGRLLGKDVEVILDREQVSLFSGQTELSNQAYYYVICEKGQGKNEETFSVFEGV